MHTWDSCSCAYGRTGIFLEWNVIQGIYQVYAGIYLVYSEYQNVAKRLDPTAPPALLHFIVSRPYVSGHPLHIRIPVIFCRDVHIITFLILWISSICHVSRMTKGNEASRAASQKGERNHEEKRKGNMKQIPQMTVTTTKQLKKRHRNSETMNASADWHKPRLTAS